MLLPDQLFARALQVSEEFVVPAQGYVPPLDCQFPGFSLPEFRRGLDLLEEKSARARLAFEVKYDLLFPEFHYDKRIHPVSERAAVEAARREFLTSLGDEPAPEDSHELEKAWIQVALWQRIMDSLARAEIPLSVTDETGAVSPPRVPYGIIEPAYSQESRRLIAAGQMRFQERAQKLNGSKEFMQALLLLQYSLEKRDSLEQQISYLEDRELR